MTLSKTCSAGQPITINKVLASDVSPTAAAGWNAAFDGLVSLTANPAINIASGSNVTVDGRSRYPASTYGMQITIPPGGGNGIVGAQSGSIDSVKLYNIEVVGPYCTSTKPCSTAAYGINIAPSTNQVTNLLISNCSIHGISEALRSSNWNGVTVEYNHIADTIGDGVDHEDVMYSYPSSNVTWRYNIIKNSPNDGIFFEFGGATNFSFYGNVFYASSLSFITTKAPGNYGPIYIYNNVFHAPSAAAYGFISSNGSTMNAADQVYNNVFYNVSNSLGAANSGYNAYSYTSLTGYTWPSGEVGSFTFIDTGNTFQNVGGGLFQPVANSPLIGKGKALTADGYINKDMDGRTRGAKGGWDIGAYEYPGTAPAPPTNLNVIVH
ncbi:right-handed parallel beta-helix repeat-containing protein [Granulicella arctica]|uniref:hypothetical protein n=1 Tax=Granulicella arctica TaxID=940613 RepID=UPI0021E03D7C|nr:hypothetical protein [Granulicella arctica]